MSTEEKKEPENPNPDSPQGSGLIGDTGPNTSPADDQTAQPAYSKPNFLARFKNAMLSHRSKEFLKDPRTWFELAALIVLGLYTWYAGRQSKTMNDTLGEIQKQTPKISDSATAASGAAKAAQAQLIFSERPWVSVDVQVVGPLIFDSDSITKATTLHLLVTLKNVGHTVALRAQDWEDIIPIPFATDVSPAIARQSEFCDAARIQKDRPGNPLFPEGIFREAATVGPSKEVMDRVRNTIAESKTGLVMFILVGCVDYVSPLDENKEPHHQTRFAYFVVRPDHPFSPVMGGFKPSGRVMGLALEPMRIDGNSVD